MIAFTSPDDLISDSVFSEYGMLQPTRSPLPGVFGGGGETGEWERVQSELKGTHLVLERNDSLFLADVPRETLCARQVLPKRFKKFSAGND